MNSYITRNDAIEFGIIPAIEAGDASRDDFDVEAIADRVVVRDGERFAIDGEAFWEAVAECAL